MVVTHMIDQLGMQTNTVLLHAMQRRSLIPAVFKPIPNDVPHEENSLLFTMTHFDFIGSSGCVDELDKFIERLDEMGVMMILNRKDSVYLSEYLVEEGVKFNCTGW